MGLDGTLTSHIELVCDSQTRPTRSIWLVRVPSKPISHSNECHMHINKTQCAVVQCCISKSSVFPWRRYYITIIHHIHWVIVINIVTCVTYRDAKSTIRCPTTSQCDMWLSGGTDIGEGYIHVRTLVLACHLGCVHLSMLHWCVTWVVCTLKLSSCYTDTTLHH